jgi:adenosylcobyric acid synthase
MLRASHRAKRERSNAAVIDSGSPLTVARPSRISTGFPSPERSGRFAQEALTDLAQIGGCMCISTRGDDPGETAVGGARAIMVLGTASHVGKSLIAAALCRIFADSGLHVRPFKAQNMSLNSAATPDGGEIGRAQALQAEAARVPACVDMNPVLLKPMSDQRSQVVVLGRPAGDSDARSYHTDRVTSLFPVVVAAYHRLADNADVVVLEGAGSPAEINLKAGDIVNLRMADAADAACVLVADIDRGGMFAALAGTLLLLEPHERARIRAFIVNKFRGDVALLQPGIDTIVERLGIPCAGIIPFVHDLALDEEDGVSLETRQRRGAAFEHDDAPTRRLRVAVVALPHLANATDFDALEAEPGVTLRFIRDPQHADAVDMLVLPGSKSTLADYDWLVTSGLADVVRAHARARKPLVGICAGMQMLGESIADPHGVEGGGTRTALGLLPLTTTFAPEKTTRPVAARYVAPLLFGMVPTERGPRALPAATHALGDDGAATADGMVVGTYVHDVFATDVFRHTMLAAARRAVGLAERSSYAWWQAEREARLARWSGHVRAHLDVELIMRLIGR